MSFWSIVWTFGIGGTIAIAVALFFFWPFFIGTKLGRMLLAIAAGAAAIFAVFLKGVSKGAKVEKDKALARHAKNVAIAKDETKAAAARTDKETKQRLKDRRK